MQVQENPAIETFKDCKFCSVVSKVADEDPIGTASTVDHWLIIELPQPWTAQVFTEDPKIAPLLKLIRTLILKQGIKLRPVLISPDKTYSSPDEVRVIYYRRPKILFANFEKYEYILPESESSSLTQEILRKIGGKSHNLNQYQQYLQSTDHIREILICTHGNVDAACSRFGYPLYKKIRSEYAIQTHLSTKKTPELRVWRCSHFGGHRFAPTLIELPSGQYWGHLTNDKIDQILARQGDVTKVKNNYRGWSGLNKFEQIVERELWQKYGWDWLTYERSGKTLRKGGLTGMQRLIYPIARFIPLKPVQLLLDQWTNKATWAEVEIKFSTPTQTDNSTYRARVEQKSSVMTASQSPKAGQKIELKFLPQYSTYQLDK
ncbi:Sucraseferredoxin family protein [[Leptolyngbya] sp. PCC 7376]|uniref:sucrase ferredoxin n=1 Tax=[Leptolyngbya] sp. PCC 7376 TaxID=111781 RepID=UPI00029F129D|nr:sucrase ferredoxin [[Leptolyngbya] sp. PCC 7376]AFY40269.1 Sucraseferredoxin family protein [[Leptolyngbya] sp. PCC 7376]